MVQPLVSNQPCGNIVTVSHNNIKICSASRSPCNLQADVCVPMQCMFEDFMYLGAAALHESFCFTSNYHLYDLSVQSVRAQH